MTDVQRLVSGVTDVKIFVPSKNFQVSLEFYNQLGWKTNWIHEESLAEMQLADQRILLQNYYNKSWAHNFMIYISVTDAQGWHAHVEKVIQQGNFGEARCNAPKQEDHALVTYAWDPSGVLLHFAQHEY